MTAAGAPARSVLGVQGENAWVFVKEDSIADAVKFYFKFEEDLFAEAKKVAAKGAEVKKPTEVAVAAMGTQYLTPADVSAGAARMGQGSERGRREAGGTQSQGARLRAAFLRRRWGAHRC